MTLKTIKKWITDTLAENTDFEQFCIDEVGKKLNFYRSSPVHKVVETLPFMTVYGTKKDEDKLSSGYSNVITIPIVIGIEETEDEVVESNGVKVWESTDKVEAIADEICAIISKEQSCGINGDYSYRIISKDIFITSIGEADDVEAQMIITFGKLNEV